MLLIPSKFLSEDSADWTSLASLFSQQPIRPTSSRPLHHHLRLPVLSSFLSVSIVLVAYGPTGFFGKITNEILTLGSLGINAIFRGHGKEYRDSAYQT